MLAVFALFAFVASDFDYVSTKNCASNGFFPHCHIVCIEQIILRVLREKIAQIMQICVKYTSVESSQMHNREVEFVLCLERKL